jgi:diacylglycerol kinase
MGRKVTKFLSNFVVSVLSLVILNESINNAVDAIGSKKDAE